jgi:pimeloyl-ACP methyl ester carboxylesterase
VTTFVLVPGACHGGWWYDPLVQRLNAEGHAAHAVTLAGLEDEPRLDRVINLDTHVGQAAELLSEAAVEGPAQRPGVVLVGHSYGGSVITAAADRMPDRVRALVYLDAFIPEDGDSCWSMTNDQEREWYVSAAASSGYGVDPRPFFDERARPHPLATLLQASRLTGSWRRVPTKIHVAALDWPGDSPMAGAAARARRDPEFTVQEWNTRHNVMHDGPGRVLDLIHAL